MTFKELKPTIYATRDKNVLIKTKRIKRKGENQLWVLFAGSGHLTNETEDALKVTFANHN